MASNTIAFNLNDVTRNRVYTEQKRRRRTAISIDLFCKELLLQELDRIEFENAKKESEKL